jgi:plastocyanin
MFDSRRMTYLNCFAQRFAKPGSYRYRIASAGTSALDRDKSFSIEVKEGNARDQGEQHDVRVRLEGRELVADPPDLSIAVGDLVLWAATDSSIAGYAIVGDGRGLTFSSARLASETIFTHAFGSPGVYDWVDAHGGKAGGTVEVVSPSDRPRERDQDAWLAALGRPTVITIKDEVADPRRVEILTGQTVAWVIEQAKGMTITESSLASTD